MQILYVVLDVGAVVEPAGGRSAAGGRVIIEGKAQLSGAAGGRVVDGQAGDEVVHAAVGAVDRDAHHRGPCRAVGRGRHDEVVCLAALAEAAVLPDDVDFPTGIDFGREQWAGAKAAGEHEELSAKPPTQNNWQGFV